MAKAKIRTGSQKAARRRQRKKRSGITAKRKREFTYRGYTVEELCEMPFDDMVLLLPARVRRTLTRGMNEGQKIAYEVLKNEDREITRTHRRDVPIIPQFVGKKVSVYNGKEFIEFEIKPEMIGHFTGEFAMTRSDVKHSGPGVGATRGSKFLPLK
ncbi:MAG: 30S ribosomal protein S19 [Euryarchaeota archaeon]|nr:30S ribosomal protein S19 [Euryarchaeota archaeon]